MSGQRRNDQALRALAADGVLAYVQDEDADLLNITEAAVALDPMFAALNLTALAGRAVLLLAAATGETVEVALAQVVRR